MGVDATEQQASKKKLRVILLTHGGAEKVLEKLQALNDVVVAGVFIETQITPQRSLKEKIKRSIRYDGYLATAKKLARTFSKNANDTETSAIKNGQQELSELAKKMSAPVHFVSSYHTDEAINLMREADADLGIIYGTNIIKETVFGIPRLGSINFHKGLAPLYRGGPPIFWELFNDEKEIGLTVHFVAAKVDTGDIILQETVALEYDYKHGLDFESFISEYSAGLKERSAELVAEAVRLIATENVTRKKQDTSKGTRYRLPTKKEKDELKKRLRKREAK